MWEVGGLASRRGREGPPWSEWTLGPGGRLNTKGPRVKGERNVCTPPPQRLEQRAERESCMGRRLERSALGNGLPPVPAQPPKCSPWRLGWKGKKVRPEGVLSRRPASGALSTRSKVNRPGERAPGEQGPSFPGKARGFGLHFPGTGRGVRASRSPCGALGRRPASTEGPDPTSPEITPATEAPVPVEKAPKTYGFPAPPHSDCSQFLGGCGRRP